MKKVYLLAVALFIGLAVSAEANGQACPVVSGIYGPAKVEAGGSVSLKVLVSGGDPNSSPTYNWMVSEGQLSGGQGTAKVTLDSTGAKDPITVTLDIGGYDRTCPTTRTTTISIIPKPATEAGT
jgi:hypothetical protein